MIKVVSLDRFGGMACLQVLNFEVANRQGEVMPCHVVILMCGFNFNINCCQALFAPHMDSVF